MYVKKIRIHIEPRCSTNIQGFAVSVVAMGLLVAGSVGSM